MFIHHRGCYLTLYKSFLYTNPSYFLSCQAVIVPTLSCIIFFFFSLFFRYVSNLIFFHQKFEICYLCVFRFRLNLINPDAFLLGFNVNIFRFSIPFFPDYYVCDISCLHLNFSVLSFIFLYIFFLFPFSLFPRLRFPIFWFALGLSIRFAYFEILLWFLGLYSSFIFFTCNCVIYRTEGHVLSYYIRLRYQDRLFYCLA